MSLEPGLVFEQSLVVREEDTAAYSAGPDLPRVFSTPRMIGLMERTAHNAVAPLLEPGQGTVGVVVNVRHLAATPVGMTVRFRAELLEVDGRRLRFKVEAWDEQDKIGEGEHERAVIDKAKFDRRLEEKTAKMQGK